MDLTITRLQAILYFRPMQLFRHFIHVSNDGYITDFTGNTHFKTREDALAALIEYMSEPADPSDLPQLIEGTFTEVKAAENVKEDVK